MSKDTDAHPMNDYKAKIEAILGDNWEMKRAEELEPTVASLLQLINEARISEATIALDAAQNIDSAIGIGTVIYNRIAELKGEKR